MAGSEPLRVLVAGDNYYASLATVRGLRRGGYEPWFAHYEELTFAARSRATAGSFLVPHPNAGDEAYVRALADAAEQCGASVVLPCNELALKAVAAHLHVFPAGLVVGSLSRETVARATDKALLGRLACAAGLSAPPTLEVGLDSLDEVAHEIAFPAIVKAARSARREEGRTWLAPPSAIVYDLEALRAQLAGSPDRIVQPFIEGALTAVSGVAWAGEIVCSVSQVARRTFPEPIGVSAFAETVPSEEAIVGPIGEILRNLGWSGIFEIQLIRTPDAAYVIDLNPRPYGSIGLAIAAGLNLPSIWVDLLLGREPRVQQPRVGVHYRAESREARALAGAVLAGRLGRALRIVRPHRRTVHSIWSLRDPAPALVALELFRRGRRARARTSASASTTSQRPASSPTG